MDIISTKTEIKDKDKTDSILNDDFKFQAEGNFAKIILDFISENNEIRIKEFKCTEETIDKKDYYICSATIVLKKKLDAKGRLSSEFCNMSELVLDNNKIKIKQIIKEKKYDVIGKEVI